MNSRSAAGELPALPLICRRVVEARIPHSRHGHRAAIAQLDRKGILRYAHHRGGRARELSAEEVIPCSQKRLLIFLDDTRTAPDVGGPETSAIGEANRFQPEPRFQRISRDMYVGRLTAIA